MQVQVNNNNFQVSWYYDRKEVKASDRIMNVPTSVHCKIYRIVSEDKMELIAEGHAHCHPRDNFNKNTGRKLSLSKAFVLSNNDRVFNKPERTSFWMAYHKMRGDEFKQKTKEGR